VNEGNRRPLGKIGAAERESAEKRPYIYSRYEKGMKGTCQGSQVKPNSRPPESGTKVKDHGSGVGGEKRVPRNKSFTKAGEKPDKMGSEGMREGTPIKKEERAPARYRRATEERNLREAEERCPTITVDSGRRTHGIGP